MSSTGTLKQKFTKTIWNKEELEKLGKLLAEENLNMDGVVKEFQRTYNGSNNAIYEAAKKKFAPFFRDKKENNFYLYLYLF